MLTPLEEKLHLSLSISLTALTEVAQAHIKMGNPAAIKVATAIMDVVDKQLPLIDEVVKKRKESN